jgi:hypothetical protein
MITETFADQQVSLVVSIDKIVLQVCYDVCQTDLCAGTLLRVIRKVPGDVMHKCNTLSFVLVLA